MCGIQRKAKKKTTLKKIIFNRQMNIGYTTTDSVKRQFYCEELPKKPITIVFSKLKLI